MERIFVRFYNVRCFLFKFTLRCKVSLDGRECIVSWITDDSLSLVFQSKENYIPLCYKHCVMNPKPQVVTIAVLIFILLSLLSLLTLATARDEACVEFEYAWIYNMPLKSVLKNEWSKGWRGGWRKMSAAITWCVVLTAYNRSEGGNVQVAVCYCDSTSHLMLTHTLCK